MYRVREKRPYTLLLFLIFSVLVGFCALCGSAYGEVLFIKGEMNSSVTAYVTKRITSYTGTKNLSYRLYYPDSISSGLWTQKITGLYKSFTPYPTDVEEFVDEYGNNGALLSWNKDIRIVQLDLQFKAQIYSNFYPVSSNAPFPVILEAPQEIYLGSAALAPSNDFIINYIGRTLSKDLYREVDVVNSVFLWIDRNIGLSSNPEAASDHSALSVLKQREGDEEGISNLACSILKGLGIPARVAYGISFQKEIPIVTPDETVIFDLPNKERYWVEVFFPDFGWSSYDPHGIYLGLLSHVIKMAHGPDSEYAAEVWNVEKGESNLFKEFIFDIKSDEVSVEFKKYGDEELGKLVLSPPVQDLSSYSEEPNLGLDALKPYREEATREAPAPQATAGEEKDFFLANIDISRNLDIAATRNRVYAQRFTVDSPVNLTEVRLPLIKFSDDGRIWVEIFTDSDGMPGQKLFRTYTIRSTVIRHMMEDNPWIAFPVGKTTESGLLPGTYWIALRSSGDCIFNWYASEGNVVGGSKDTRFMDVSLKKHHWNSVMNYDMNFQIVGSFSE